MSLPKTWTLVGCWLSFDSRKANPGASWKEAGRGGGREWCCWAMDRLFWKLFQVVSEIKDKDYKVLSQYREGYIWAPTAMIYPLKQLGNFRGSSYITGVEGGRLTVQTHLRAATVPFAVCLSKGLPLTSSCCSWVIGNCRHGGKLEGGLCQAHSWEMFQSKGGKGIIRYGYRKSWHFWISILSTLTTLSLNAISQAFINDERCSLWSVCSLSFL